MFAGTKPLKEKRLSPMNWSKNCAHPAMAKARKMALTSAKNRRSSTGSAKTRTPKAAGTRPEAFRKHRLHDGPDHDPGEQGNENHHACTTDRQRLLHDAEGCEH
jgi:hypothetical protein